MSGISNSEKPHSLMEFSLEVHEGWNGLILADMCAQQMFLHLRDFKQFFYTLISYKKLSAEIH